MHFWIDKRSQFGRSRVSASLCNHGMGMSHYPPNRRNKTTTTGTQVHRSQHGEGRSSNYYHTNANSNYTLNGQPNVNNNNVPTTSATIINSNNLNISNIPATNNNNGNVIGAGSGASAAGANNTRNSRIHRETTNHYQNNNGYNAIRNFQHHPQFGVNANFARQIHRQRHYGNGSSNNSSSSTINTAENGHLPSNDPFLQHGNYNVHHYPQQQHQLLQQYHQSHHNGNRSNQIVDHSNNSANQIDCNR